MNYGFGVTKNTVFLRCVLSDIFCFMIAENWNSQFFHPSHLQRHNKSSGCHRKDTNFNHIDGKKHRTCHGKEVHNKMNPICKNRCSQSRVHKVKPWPALCVQSAEPNDKNMQLLLQQHGKQQIGSCSDKERGNPCLKLHPSCNEQSNRSPPSRGQRSR